MLAMRHLKTDTAPRVSKLCVISHGKGWMPSHVDRVEQALLDGALRSGEFDGYSDDAWCELCESRALVGASGGQ